MPPLVLFIFNILITLAQGALLFLVYTFEGSVSKVLEHDFYVYSSAVGFINGIVFLSFLVIHIFSRGIVSAVMVDYQAYVTFIFGLLCLGAYFFRKYISYILVFS